MSRRITDDASLHRIAADMAAGLPEAELANPFGFGTDVFRVGEKLFMLNLTHPQGHPLVNVKCDPEHAELLREAEDSITPGYHMNKRHWISIGVGVERDLLEELITTSYLLVHHSLPARTRPVLPDHLLGE